MKRKTIQRALTLRAVQTMQSHPTADEVYETVSAEHPNISRGTVYRNLNQLSEDGEIREMEVPGGADRFDHCCHAHYHVRCLTCGRVFDVDMDYIPDLANSIKDNHGFQFSGYDLMFKGICPACLQAQAETHPASEDDGSPP